MEEILKQIEVYREQLKQLSPLKPEYQFRLDKKFRLEWNYNSNHIEGNTLTYGETELLLIFGQTKGNHEIREYEEMKGHDLALKLVEDLAADKEAVLTEKFIREINGIILKEPFYKEAITPDGQPTRKLIRIGEYKSLSNSVRLQNGEIFHYASPQETPALMNDLLEWYKEASTDTSKHPVEAAAALHYRFVRIHPFDDGNGRISRLLMNYHLLKNDYPPVIIKSANKKDYLFALHEADTGDFNAFVKFVAEQLLWSYEISIKAARGESVDERGDWEKKVEIFKRSEKINAATETQKNVEIVKRLIEDSAKRLFISIENKTKIFDDLFNGKRIHVNFDSAASLQIIEANQITNLLPNYIGELLTKFSFSFFFDNYKYKGFDDFSVNRTITFRFNKLFYEVIYGNNSDDSSVLIKKYSEDLSHSDVILITETVCDSLFKQIEKHSKK